MFKKVNSKLLGLLFIVLLAIVVIVLITDKKRGNSSAILREISFNEIDTSKITKMVFYPRDNKEEFKIAINSSTGKWEVFDKDKKFTADKNSINNLLNELANIKVERIAAKTKDSWEKYQLTDSLGIRVTVFNNEETLADIVVGKFNFQQPPQQSNPYQRNNNMKFSTFIRNYNEEMVYLIDGMMSMNFNVNPNSLRNKTICSVNKADIKKIVFTYPADSSFTLIKTNDVWLVNGVEADSLKTDQYFNSISRLNSTRFANDINVSILPQTDFNIRIEGDNFIPIIISSFPYQSKEHIISSSENTDAYFDGDVDGLFKKIFISKNSIN